MNMKSEKIIDIFDRFILTLSRAHERVITKANAANKTDYARLKATARAMGSAITLLTEIRRRYRGESPDETLLLLMIDSMQRIARIEALKSAMDDYLKSSIILVHTQRLNEQQSSC